MIESLLLPGQAGPKRLVTETAAKTEDPTELRIGVVSSVSARGITVAVADGEVGASHLDSYAPAVGDTTALVKAQDTWVALGRVVGSATPVDNQAPGGAAGPSILDGLVTSGPSTLASSTGGQVTVPKYSISFYHPVNHQVMIIAGFFWTATNAADYIVAQIYETSTGTPLLVGEFVENIENVSFGRHRECHGLANFSFGGSARTYVLKMARVAGAGTVSITENVNARGYMYALDLGDSSVFRVV